MIRQIIPATSEGSFGPHHLFMPGTCSLAFYSRDKALNSASVLIIPRSRPPDPDSLLLAALSVSTFPLRGLDSYVHISVNHPPYSHVSDNDVDNISY